MSLKSHKSRAAQKVERIIDAIDIMYHTGEHKWDPEIWKEMVTIPASTTPRHKQQLDQLNKLFQMLAKEAGTDPITFSSTTPKKNPYGKKAHFIIANIPSEYPSDYLDYLRDTLDDLPKNHNFSTIPEDFIRWAAIKTNPAFILKRMAEEMAEKDPDHRSEDNTLFKIQLAKPCTNHANALKQMLEFLKNGFMTEEEQATLSEDILVNFRHLDNIRIEKDRTSVTVATDDVQCLGQAIVGLLEDEDQQKLFNKRFREKHPKEAERVTAAFVDELTPSSAAR